LVKTNLKQAKGNDDFGPSMMRELDGRLEKIQMLMHMYAPF
jgi:hypothetical protein